MGVDAGHSMGWSASGERAGPFVRRLVAAGVLAAVAIGVAIVRFAPERPAFGAAEAQRGADLLAAGDIAECPGGDAEATARLLERLPGTIAALGDEAYPDGSERAFAGCYAPSWGRLINRTRPVPGNHEYVTPGAAPYYRYFGRRAGKPGEGWYSYELGAWHVVALNSGIDVGPGSAQVAWLRDDLAAHPGRCVLAYWHTPRFSLGPHGSRLRMAAIWDVLYGAGAAVVLSGHDHMYERFAPMTSAGHLDPARGIRQFVVGTGGAGLYRVVAGGQNAEVVNSGTHGVLHMRLLPTGYTWEFVPVAGGTFTDSGRAPCRPR
ncbi:MAG: Alkaline phosphatase precursor [Gemmatimonadetes bacterium]|nr:Alkaline phosphatase precursor [Gemmatimonadota bacterium]